MSSKAQTRMNSQPNKKKTALSEQLPVPERMQTRAKNKDAHPGLPDRGPSRRSTQEVQAIHKEQAAANEAAAVAEAAAIRHVAEIEYANKEMDQRDEREANHPSKNKHTEKARHARPVNLSLARHIQQDIGDGGLPLPHDPVSSEDEDEYGDSENQGDLESEDSISDTGELENEEESKTAKSKKRRTKVGRAAIEAEVTALQSARRSTDAAKAVVGKRSASAASESSEPRVVLIAILAGVLLTTLYSRSKKAKVPKGPSGLFSDWRNPTRKVASRATPGGGHGRAASVSSKTSSMPPTSDGEVVGSKSDGGLHFGGLQDEDEELEHAATAQSPLSWTAHAVRAGARGSGIYAMLDDERVYDRLTTIRMNNTSNRFNLKGARTSRTARKKPTTSDVPEHMREKFTQVLVPLAREHLGTLPPWTTMPLEDFRALFKRVFPDEDHVIEEGDVYHRLLTFRLTDWQSNFGSAALKAITDYIERNREDLADTDAIKEWIAFELGDNNRNRPFLWKEWNDGKKKMGRLQSELILRTLTAHLQALAVIPANIGLSDKPPVGALIYSVLAVERALGFWKDGIKRVPPGSAGHFSEDYWGDRIEYVNGRNVNNRRASRYLKVTTAFTEKNWEDIWDGAYFFFQDKKRQSYQQPPRVVEDAEEDFDMESDPSDVEA
ncbi:hypothetical protein OBBRIDRAFT_837456 [Obba rivulosa]|uniref:Uncharacterized protein n=1 Tax=Obba rivulosa TaxID=1052685 RepID=A0A8E2DJ01_9APHY|nr:hypothetical protein OBBRIDRAFT_837456 [Obba rivulosa]